LDERK